MKKQTEKRVMAGSSMVLPTNSTGRSTKAQRIRQRATREEVSENHGASKRVKITVETCVESLEQHIGDNHPSQDNIMITEDGIIVPTVPSATNEDYLLDADCDVITSNEQSEESDVKALPQRSQVVSTSNPSDEKELLKKEMSLKAKDLLKINDTVAPANALVPAASQVLSSSHKRSTYANDNVTKVYDHRSSEYVVNPLYTPNLDFSMFKNKKMFKNTINLKNKSLKECIITFNKTQFNKVKEHNRIHELLTYLLLLEKENDIVLEPEVIGCEFLHMFECFLYNFSLAPRTVAYLCLKLKQIIKWTSHYGIDIQYNIDEWKPETDDAKPKVALTEEDIVRIYWFDINTLPFRSQKKRTMERVRDHFVLSCYLGQRQSDSKRINKENFKGSSYEVFEITQQKTGSNAVLKFNDIFGEFPDCARRILEKYEYCSPWSGDISNYNKYLHELMRLIGFNKDYKHEYKVHGQMITKHFKKWELISSHTPRRSFITNAVKRNISNEVIKKASGHKSDSSFGKYVLLYNS